VSAYLSFTWMHYAHAGQVHVLHIDTRRRRCPSGVAVGGRQTSCTRLNRLPTRRLHDNAATQLVRVPSSATASGITTVAQVVQMQVGTLRVTALPAPTRSMERVAQAVGRDVAGVDAEQGAHRRGTGSASRRRSGQAGVCLLSKWEELRGTNVSLSTTRCLVQDDRVVWMAGRPEGVKIGR